MNMNEKNIPLIIQILEKQLSERIEKLWRVFSWTSNIQIAITAGIFFFGKKGELRFDKYELIIISLIILILTVYAYLWINENLKSEKKIRDQLGLIFEKELNYLSIKDIQSDKVRFGYK
jgi:predicted Na+-dependent transporter